jgi:hypothetical protein
LYIPFLLEDFFLKEAKALPYSLIKKELEVLTNRAKLGKQNDYSRGIIEPMFFLLPLSSKEPPLP